MKQANALQDQHGNKGTLNLIVANNKQSGKPEIYAVVGQPYNKQSNQGGQQAGPFGGSSFGQPASNPVPQQAPAPQPFAGTNPVPGAREVQFGKVDVPVDDFDKLLENL